MSYPEFVAAGAEVRGISPDDAETLARYKREKETPFDFVPDPSQTVAAQFGVGRGGRVKRATFVIARGGKIARVMHHEVRIGKHIKDALKAVRAL